MPVSQKPDPERQRLADDRSRKKNWKRWGPYLPERQWGTVREDYSKDGSAWEHFPFEHSHLRAYRWGEDGLLGLADREGRLCFSTAFWNGNDPILKERLFGLSNAQGNHGEDCKELYYYLDSTPTHSYCKALYKYPQQAFPYEKLLEENSQRSLEQNEYEILDTGVFDDNRYFDIVVEYAKNSPNDLLIRITATNRGPETALLHILPKIWFRNTWIWGCKHEGCTLKPKISVEENNVFKLQHQTLDTFYFAFHGNPDWGFAENETDTLALYETGSYTPYTKGAFSRWILEDDPSAVTRERGTMAMLRYRKTLEPSESTGIQLRMYSEEEKPKGAVFSGFEQSIAKRIKEADSFWKSIQASKLDEEDRAVQRQAYAGLLWSKQFYHYSIDDWLRGDPDIGKPPEGRLEGRNHDWSHLYNRDVISMPDKWEYPWYAAWDLAFHMIPFADIDIDFAKQQLILFLREWYMHPNGQLPAYEWELGDVNPPTHAWSCWQVYNREKERTGSGDFSFLKRVFTKLLLNFTWWVNRKDPEGNNIFGGGFLGLDNIGLFDRSKPLPGGATLRQADGTAWMAFYSSTMLAIALELARHDEDYDNIASKFFEHFMGIAHAINHFGDNGLWDEETGFYYDEIKFPDESARKIKARSLVGLIPMIAAHSIESDLLDRLPGFRKRMNWYLQHRTDITSSISCQFPPRSKDHAILLAIPTTKRLRAMLRYLFDENEFLSPYGIRSLSKHHYENPFGLELCDTYHNLEYCPGDSDTHLFGGNSNWRGPIWFPLNFLLIEAIKKYGDHYGDNFKVEYPTGSGKERSLKACAQDIELRLCRLFRKTSNGHRPYYGEYEQLRGEHFDGYHQFFEYFNGDTGKGHGASHQTGWTALIATLLQDSK